jgi:hypothetical protein
MKKLSLDLDALEVETFETAQDEPRRGTVHGHASWHYQGCTPYEPCNPVSSNTYTEDYTCDDHSCWQSCQQSCGGTCNATCTCPSQVNTCWETCFVTDPC